jgi:hypothetical protein
MLFGSLKKPVACQSQENAPLYYDDEEDEDMMSSSDASLSTSKNSSQESVAFEGA